MNGYGLDTEETYISPGWTDWHVSISPNYYNYRINHDGSVRAYGSAPKDYYDDVIIRTAVDYIEQKAEAPEAILHVGELYRAS